MYIYVCPYILHLLFAQPSWGWQKVDIVNMDIHIYTHWKHKLQKNMEYIGYYNWTAMKMTVVEPALVTKL